MFTIRKTFRFEAAHRLTHLPTGHKCSRRHGHSYTATVELAASALNTDGFVLDYGLLDCIKHDIAQAIDHRDLNEVFPLHPTTAEHLAETLYYRWQTIIAQEVSNAASTFLRAVTVCETDATSAEYRPEVQP